MNNLDKLGFFHLRNVLDVKNAVNAISGNTMRYDDMKSFVDKELKDVLNNSLGWDMQYMKFRVSDNNNSADAGAFHRDIICQDVQAKDVKCYTVLVYMDESIMELIPGSHKTLQMSYIEAFASFNQNVQIKIKPGDVLIIRSTLLHRGIFTDSKQLHRRLIQVFDVFDSPEMLKKNLRKFLHIEGDETYSDFMIKLNRHTVTSGVLNWFGYLNAATGYGQLGIKGVTYLSSEGLRGRVVPIKGSYQEINKYFINVRTVDLPKDSYQYYRFIAFNRQFILYMIISIGIMIMILVLAIMTLRLLIKKHKQAKVKTLIGKLKKTIRMK